MFIVVHTRKLTQHSQTTHNTATDRPSLLPLSTTTSPPLLLPTPPRLCVHHHTTPPPSTKQAQVTDAIKQYVEEKINKAVHNYAQNIKKIDVTLSARGGDTGTHGAK